MLFCNVLPPVTRNLASLVLLAAVLSGQPATTQKPGKVEGVVTNSVTGDPVKKANVTMQGTGNYSTVTDAAGHFQFDSVGPGTYFPMAMRDGFMPDQRKSNNSAVPDRITVAEEQQIKDVAIKLVPMAVISGHVLDEDGDPVVQAQVQALRYTYRQVGTRQLNPAGFANTNDIGEYEMLNLPPGRYYFRASFQRRQRQVPPRTRSSTPEQAYPNTFYPSAMLPAQATATQVAAGAQLSNLDIRLRKASAYHVRGKVVGGRTGQALRNAMMNLQPRERSYVVMNFSPIQRDGTFDVSRIVSGSYVAVVSSEEVSCEQDVNVADQDVDDLLLVCRPPLEISGTIRTEGTPPETKGSMQQVMLQSMDRNSGVNAVVDKDGNFVVKTFPGVYQLSVNGMAGVYAKSMHFGDQDVSSGRLDLTQQSSGNLNIVMGTDVGEIQGSVQNGDGEPAPGVVITLVPDEAHQGRQDLHYQFGADEKGKFDYRDIAPGDYKVYAWEGPDMEVVQSPEFEKAFESRATAISVQSAGHVTIQLKSISAADVEAEKNKQQ